MLHKEPLFLSGVVCYPPQIVQHNGLQLALMDIVGGAVLCSVFTVSAAFEGSGASSFPIYPHDRATVCTVQHTRERAGLFIDPFGRASFVIADSLNNIPQLF